MKHALFLIRAVFSQTNTTADWMANTNSRTRIRSLSQQRTGNLQENTGIGRQTSRRQEYNPEGSKPYLSPILGGDSDFRDAGETVAEAGWQSMAPLAATAAERRSICLVSLPPQISHVQTSPWGLSTALRLRRRPAQP